MKAGPAVCVVRVCAYAVRVSALPLLLLCHAMSLASARGATCAARRSSRLLHDCWPALRLRGGESEGATLSREIERDLAEGGAGARRKLDEDGKMEQDKVLIAQLQAMRRECSNLKQRISMIAEEIADHTSAASVVEAAEGSRPCKRAVGGILIDSTASEVLPALRNEIAMLTKASHEMTTKLQDSEKAMAEFQTKHKIRIVGEEMEGS